MAHRSEHIRRRILLAFGVVSFLGMATAILCIFWMQTHRSQVELQQQLAGTQRLLDSLVREESKVLLSQLRLLSGNERLQHAWLAGDRKKLLNISKPLFADLKTEYRIDHFYFIEPDRTCFLRVHKPDRYGDLITRYSLKEARQTGTPAHGLELGPLGTFTLRQVLPWRIDGKIAGYLELGESIENIAPKFQEIIGVKLLFVINKDHLDRVRWEEGMRMRGKFPDWGHFPDVVVENETMAAIPAELERLIRLPYREQRNRPFAITGENNTCFQGGFLPLVDSRGKELGEIVVLHDVTGEFSSLFRLTAFLIAVLVLLSGGLFWFFFFFMGRVERELLAARDDLVKEIEERRQAQRKLTGYKEQLEEIVADRTQELRAANAGLREEVASRELAERRAWKATEDWERTFNAIGDIITLQDEKMRMVRVNRAAAEAFGVEPQDLVGRHCYEIFRGKDHPCEACPEPQALRQLKMHSAEIEHPNLGKTFLVTASPLVDQEGRFGGVVHTAKDITEKKQLESQLRQAQRIEAVGTLAGGVAHDFNNLLTGIIGYAELCLGEADPGFQFHPDLTEIMRLAKRGADLIRQLQAFSLQQISEPVALDLNELIANLLKMLGRLIGENIDLQFRPAPELGRVLADPGQLEQVLINLAVNARDAMPQGGVLAIEISEAELDPAAGQYVDLAAGSYARLVVRDSGHGMDRETLQRIFDPFFSTKDCVSSSGLGLAVIFGIIKQHRGSIQAESNSGQGTTFTIHLPLVSGEQATQIAPSSLSERITILLVEDEPAVREVIGRMIEKIGCHVIVAEDPEEAEELFRSKQEEISLLMSDVVMPRRNGWELYERLVDQDPGLRVLFMSGYVDNPVVQMGIIQAGLPFIAKPFSPDKLAVKIEEILKGGKKDGRARLHGGVN